MERRGCHCKKDMEEVLKYYLAERKLYNDSQRITTRTRNMSTILLPQIFISSLHFPSSTLLRPSSFSIFYSKSSQNSVISKKMSASAACNFFLVCCKEDCTSRAAQWSIRRPKEEITMGVYDGQYYLLYILSFSTQFTSILWWVGVWW